MFFSFEEACAIRNRIRTDAFKNSIAIVQGLAVEVGLRFCRFYKASVEIDDRLLVVYIDVD